jgi:effector protein HopAB
MIVRELRDAGVDLADVRGNVAAAMQRDPVGFDVRAVSILQPHFPRLYELGLSADDPLAAALLHTLSVSAPAAPRARLAPAGPRPRPTAGPVRNAQTPPSAGGSPARTARGQERAANTPLLRQLAGAGVDIGRLAAAIDQTVRNGHALPEDIGRALRRAGIEPHVEGRGDRVSHALMQLRREIHQATGGGGDASPPREARQAPRIGRRAPAGIPPIGATRLHRIDAEAVRARLTIPERAPGENNAQYAWRVRRQNPGASVAEAAAAAVGPSGHLNLQSTISELNALIRTQEKISAAFGGLRALSADDAKRMGFVDGETDCLFGEELSLRNANQKVIGLAQQPSNPSRSGYDARTNKDVVFMDLNKLAEYLATKPRHPMNNLPLDAKNIRDFAFRIE